MRINNGIGRRIGFKLGKLPYSRPSTLKAREMFDNDPIRVIEIGCAAGINALDILEQLNVTEYIIVDPYEHANAAYDDYGRARLSNMREQARRRLKKHESKLVWLCTTSDEAVSQIKGTVDYIYVDGDHSYEAVLTDMRNYYGFAADRFVFGGHDIDRPDVARAFVDFVTEKAIPHYEIKDPDWIVYSP